MANKVVSATEFKAKCLALLDEVDEKGTTITVTKRGRPVVVVRPTHKSASKSSRDSWKSKGQIVGDIVNTDWSNLWSPSNSK